MEEEEKAPSLRMALYELLRALVMVMVAMYLICTFLVRPFKVIGTSMLPTLCQGDTMLVQTLGYTPEQGDVVVLNKYFSTVDHPIVKRIIATGGQSVRLDYDAGLVYVDGVALEEPYLLDAMLEPPYPHLTEVEVPEGCIFVMGDNRNNSLDGRSVELGAVDTRYVIGRAVFVVSPFRDFGFLEVP